MRIRFVRFVLRIWWLNYCLFFQMDKYKCETREIGNQVYLFVTYWEGFGAVGRCGRLGESDHGRLPIKTRIFLTIVKNSSKIGFSIFFNGENSELNFWSLLIQCEKDNHSFMVNSTFGEFIEMWRKSEKSNICIYIYTEFSINN